MLCVCSVCVVFSLIDFLLAAILLECQFASIKHLRILRGLINLQQINPIITSKYTQSFPERNS